ncbi:hypothetical protein D3C86_1550510 [compost metagenome]
MLVNVRPRNTPGMVAIHQALRRYFRPSAMILPKVGVGGWTPRPRNPRVDSKIIIRATSSTEVKITGGSSSGRSKPMIMRASVEPPSLAARTYSRCLSVITILRMMRA